MTNQTIVDAITGNVTQELYDPIPAPPAPPQMLIPYTFASMGVTIENGAVTSLDLAAGLQSVVYEDGWLMGVFAEPQKAAEYMVFPATDKPLQIERYKEDGYFELVFSENGAPAEPAQISIQIIKVR